MRYDLDGRDKTITLSGDGLDKSRRLARILQPLPNLENGRPDTRIDVREDIGGPQALGDVFACDQFASTLEQQEEHLHRLSRQRNAASVPTRFVRRHIHFDLPEAVRHGA